MPTIYWAGDSTVQYNDITTYPQTGLGQVLHLFLKPEVHIANFAKNGRSTKSFLDEKRLDPIEDQIAEGDFLFIQFGHNDEKVHDPSRYTEPFGSFQTNLARFVSVARAHGAYPILITPLERRCFDADGTLTKGEHGDYVAGMKQLATRLSVPLIDLHAKSRKALMQAGPELTKTWYMHVDGKEDNTHLQYAGAVRYAACIAEGLNELGGLYCDLLLAQE